MRRICAGLFSCTLAWLGPLQAAIHITQIQPNLDTLAITWSAEAGRTYKVLWAPIVAGPWAERASLQTSSTSLSWTNVGMLEQRQGFFRVMSPATATAGTELKAAAVLPSHAERTASATATIGAQAVFLASTLGAGGQQLLTSGTLTEQGADWAFEATPDDRLRVQFQSGSNLTYYVTRMEGDFTGDATAFLERPHVFDYRVIQPNVGDMTYSNSVAPGTCNFLVTSSGTLSWSNVTYVVSLTQGGTYCVDTSFGYELVTDTTTAGSITGPGTSLNVDHRWRYHLIGGGGGSASSVEEWNNSSLTYGGDTFQWVNTKRQKSFKDGKPSSLETYWQCHGNVLKNGADYGIYRLQPIVHLGVVRFILELPAEVIELESWNVLL